MASRVKASGLIFTPHLNASGISALDIHFEPAMVISARKVDKLGLSIRSFREPLKKSIQKVIIPSIRKNFDAGGRDPRWVRLSPDTRRQKAFYGYSDKPLIRTGALRQQMGYLNIWTIDTEKAFIRDLPASIWYGKVHQAGATFRAASSKSTGVAATTYLGRSLGSGHGETGVIPARPFVVLRRMDEIQIQKIFNDWLGKKIREAGLSGGRVGI